jgi:2-isopropylmalate synthase
MAFFKRVPELSLKHARVAAFGSTAHPKNSKVEDDNNIQALIESGTPVVHHLRQELGFACQGGTGNFAGANIELIRDSVAYLKSLGKEVILRCRAFLRRFPGRS